MFNCQEEFNDVAVCLEREYNVEMDRRRRDIHRNPEPWWRQYYDQDGEVGRQAEFKDLNYGVIDSIRWTLFGTDRDKKFEV